jgi:hypothetical protein
MTRNLPMVVQTPGIYTIGLYDRPDGTETDHLFPLPVVKANPFAASAPEPTTPM